MSSSSIYWYDFETFGANPQKDRVCQFAGVRTDENLNIIGDPLVIFCKPSDDFLPNPFACLITGITPQTALAKGINEFEFTRKINEEFSTPNTCVVGYNNIKFDDEFMRRLLYRNLFDPYEREYKNQNSRWDIIDMVRLCGAVRPEGIEWPRTKTGRKSFKLDQLTVKNGIEHGDAHDALADVLATIEIAKLIKTRQPKLFEYVFNLREKNKVRAIASKADKPILHIATRYSSQKGYMGLVLPICEHPTIRNRFIVYNLGHDPNNWIGLEAEEIEHRIQTHGTSPFGLISATSCPILVTPKILTESAIKEYGLDLNSSLENARVVQKSQTIKRTLSKIYSEKVAEKEADPDLMIYQGFFGDRDKAMMETVRNTKPADLGRLDLPFEDHRLDELFFRYRARNFRETLTSDEVARWDEYRKNKFKDDYLFQQFENDMEEAAIHVGKTKIKNGSRILAELEEYANQVRESLRP